MTSAELQVLARMGLFLVNDLAAIDAVLQHQVERTARERLTTAAIGSTAASICGHQRAPPSTADRSL